MAGLPKIAMARLRTNPTPKSGSAAAEPVPLGGGGHPDANLLGALAEKTLTETERAQVLNHLVRCADCRAVAAFAAPEERGEAELAGQAGGRSPVLWPVLRWGALATVLGALAMVMVSERGLWNKHPELAKVTIPAASAERAPAASREAAPPAVASPEVTKKQGARSAPADQLAAKQKAFEPRSGVAAGDRNMPVQARQPDHLMTLVRPSAPAGAEVAPATRTEMDQSLRGSTAARVVAAPAAPATAPSAPSNGAAKLRTNPAASAEPTPAVGQNAEVVAGGPVVVAGRAPAEAAPAHAGARVSAEATAHMMSRAPALAASSTLQGLPKTPASTAAAWSVTSDGQVQRSTDGGKTIAPVPVAPGIKFRAVAALGDTVWTGGSGGALYHSADGGVTWSQAGVSFQGTTITETITGLQMADPQHLTVTTASGAQWLTGDGGQTWQAKP